MLLMPSKLSMGNIKKEYNNVKDMNELTAWNLIQIFIWTWIIHIEISRSLSIQQKVVEMRVTIISALCTKQFVGFIFSHKQAVFVFYHMTMNTHNTSFFVFTLAIGNFYNIDTKSTD